MKVRLCAIKLFLVILLILMASPVIAADYYISPSGNDAGSGSVGDPWRSLSRADGSLSAGDTLYCRGGTYTSTLDYFQSSASGTQNNPITIRNYPGETPIFRSLGNLYGDERHILYITHNYIFFDGLHFRPTDTSTQVTKPIYISGSHVTIQNCYLEGANLNNGWYGFNALIFVTGNYATIYNNTLIKGGKPNDPHGNSGNIVIVYGNYAKIHGNNIQRGVHDCVRLDGSYNEVYDNTFTHAMGYAIYFQAGSSKNLAERNNITGCDEDLTYVKNPIYIKGDSNIIRYNEAWNNEVYGYDQDAGSYNRIYNNVFYNNGDDGFHGWPYTTCQNNIHINNVIAKNYHDASCNNYHTDIVIGNGYRNSTNEFKYNWIQVYTGGQWVSDASCSVYVDDNNRESVSQAENAYPEWEGNIYNYSDPKFVNAANGDFTIQAGSSLIDKGRYLTQANGGGSGTSLTVDDAKFFWYSEIDGAGDQIAIGSASQTRTITSISGNTLHLNQSASWNDGDPIYLYKSFSDSSTVLFSGSAPDIGASEYPAGQPAPPSDLRIVP